MQYFEKKTKLQNLRVRVENKTQNRKKLKIMQGIKIGQEEIGRKINMD